jgi:hypothetical protein
VLFANSMTSAGNTLLGSQHLITKVYLPAHRPTRSRRSWTAVMDFAIASRGAAGMMLAYRREPAPADRARYRCSSACDARGARISASG